MCEYHILLLDLEAMWKVRKTVKTVNKSFVFVSFSNGLNRWLMIFTQPLYPTLLLFVKVLIPFMDF